MQGMVKDYYTGDFFGESALLVKGALRAATVTAVTVCFCVCVCVCVRVWISARFAPFCDAFASSYPPRPGVFVCAFKTTVSAFRSL